jgi:hypothetical protein
VIVRGALRFILQEHDVAAIVDSVKASNNFVVTYVDHDENLGTFDLHNAAVSTKSQRRLKKEARTK